MHTLNTLSKITALTSLSLVAAACGDDGDGAMGSITAYAWGEGFIEEGIPAGDVADGWAISFDSFLVSTGNFAAKAGENSAEVGAPRYFMVDLALPTGDEGHELVTFDAPGGAYDHYGYGLRPDANAEAVNVSAADATAMKAAGYGVWVRGSATKDGVTKTFDWGFTTKLGYAHCEMAATIDGDNVKMVSTFHADHLFYDSLTSEEPDVRFQLLADADGIGGTPDGAITMEELAMKNIAAESNYQVGSLRDPDGAEITNLRQYLTVQQSTLGHINGEGHCEDVIATP